MILTLTPNSALDRVIFIEEFTPGLPMRASKVVDCVGGKGLDASVALASLGVETLGLSFVAGDIGRRLAEVLDGYGIRHDLVWLEGESRLAHVVVETRFHRHSHVMTGSLEITPAAAAELLQRYRAGLGGAAGVSMGGSLPPGLPVTYYRDMTRVAQDELGVPALIDSHGPSILAALPARPAVIKMNWREFNTTFGLGSETMAELVGQARGVFEREKLPALVITCGEDGILALTPDGVYLARIPAQQAVNAAGAGDATSAAVAWRRSLGEPWPDVLRWTAAIGAASVLTEATAECRPADVERLLPQARVEEI